MAIDQENGQNHPNGSSSPPRVKHFQPDIIQLEGFKGGKHGMENSNLFNNAAIGSGPLKQSDITHLQIQHGLNTVETGRKRKWYQVLVRALLHPFNILLILLAITSGAAEEFQTMGIMFFMVLISTFLRFYQEWKSEIAVKSLLKFVATKVTVFRVDETHGSMELEMNVDSTDLVPGDWIKLSPGDLVPADVEVVDAKDFHVSQAALTGEAIPIQKHRYYLMGSGGGTPPRREIASTTASTERILVDEDLKREKPRGRVVNFFRQIVGLPMYYDGGDKEAGSEDSDFDRPDLAFLGSSVVSGTATCRVLSTGSNTQFGRLASELAKKRPQNAFQLGVKRISCVFFITMVAMIPPVLLLQAYLGGEGWGGAFIFALAVAVGLTPEMLPMIVSTTLAKGAVEMSRKRCIVKNLDAIINMGGIDILCTDKTGTLTKSTVTLNRFVTLKGNSSSVPLFLGYLNSNFQKVRQNPLDSAIVCFFDNQDDILNGFRNFPGMSTISEKFRLIDEIPFDFVRRRMSVVLQETSEGHQDNRLLICKGAVEELLQKCTKALVPNEASASEEDTTNVYNAIRGEVDTETMTVEIQDRIQNTNEQLNEDGFRVIAVGFKRMSNEMGDENAYSVEDECDLTFVGLLAFLDPPKESSRGAIKNLLEHNVSVKVLTGDSPLVCKKICSEIGLPVDKIITGKELAQMGSGSSEKLKLIAEECSIFAKLTPLQKSDVVRALKMNGHIVGFLGDGINDAPALTEADVGISVDSGTDICKESADIILLEKDINVVVDSVITGRVTYGNTLKYIVMAISSNFGNVFSILAASAWLPFQPMASLHILVQNLLYDISQIAIPWDHMDPEFLLVPHRWSMRSVLKFMVMIGPWSSVFDIATFLFMYFYFNIKTLQDDVVVFQTAWFTVGLLTQTLIVHMIRTPKIPFIQSWASLPVVTMTVVIMGVGLVLPYIPKVSTWLNLVHLPWQVYPFLAVLLLSYCIAAQLAKMIYVGLFNEWY